MTYPSATKFKLMAHSYEVFNATDGIPAHYDFFPSVKIAKEWIAAKREGFRKVQGYYRTNRWEKISPDDINYRIIKRY